MLRRCLIGLPIAQGVLLIAYLFLRGPIADRFAGTAGRSLAWGVALVDSFTPFLFLPLPIWIAVAVLLRSGRRSSARPWRV
jgi:hypothetical protein